MPSKQLDLRICLLLTILVSIASIMLKSEFSLLLTFVLMCIWSLLNGLRYRIISNIIWYLVLWAALFLLRDIPILGQTALPLITVYVRRIMLPVMAARPLLSNANGRLVATLNRMKLPRIATLSLAILFRFLPTIKTEYSHIRDSQKFRGIGTSALAVICHPLTTIEYTLIPILIRTSKTADELSASAAVRGMRLEGACSSYHIIKLRAADYAVMLLCVAALIGIVVYDRIGMGG